MSAVSRREMVEFMDARILCVLSTVSQNAKPESAYVGYVSNQNHEIVIGTSNQSRKYQNILQNKSVAIVIADQTGEVQYEGEVEIIAPDVYEAMMAEGRFKKLPGLDKYRSDPNQVYLKVTPTWIRFIVHGPSGDDDADQTVEFTEFLDES